MTDSRTHLGDFTATRRVVPIALIACVIGVLCSFVALALLRMIAFFTNVFYFQRLSFAATSPADHHLGYWAILVPAVGGLIVGLMARFGSERIRGHGIPEAIEAILMRGSKVEAKLAFLKPLSSAISIGSGGPFGAEGPIIMTGGAFGSLIAQGFHLSAAERKTLLVAGAAAGMSATFAAPLAATLLAVELLLFEWKPRSFIPVAAASATAAIMRTFVLGPGPLFPTPPIGALPAPTALAACALVGLAAGLVAALLTAAVYASEDAFQALPFHWMWWPAIGGVVIGVGGLAAPHALGVGYDVIAQLLSGALVGRVLIALLIVKGVIWAVSLGSGTSGGVLAPLLIVGAALGALVGPWLPAEGAAFWPLIGMGAILGGAMRVPFTAVVFTLELTHDIDMVLPLLIAVAVAHAFTVLALRRSILTEKIDRRGFHVSREYATDPLELLFVSEVMSTDVVSGNADLDGPVAYPDEPLTAVVGRMAMMGRTELPVVPRGGARTALGWISLQHLLEARVRHLEEERRRDGRLPLSAVIPGWLKTSGTHEAIPSARERTMR